MASSARKCPICGNPSRKTPEEDKWRPFCSRRCADVDLGRWMSGRYRIVSDEPVYDEESIDRIPGEST